MSQFRYRGLDAERMTEPAGLCRRRRASWDGDFGARWRSVKRLQPLLGVALVLLDRLAGRLHWQQVPDHALHGRDGGGVGPALGLPQPRPLESARAVQEALLDLD